MKLGFCQTCVLGHCNVQEVLVNPKGKAQKKGKKKKKNSVASLWKGDVERLEENRGNYAP